MQLAPLQAGLGSIQIDFQPPQQVHLLPGRVIGGGQDRAPVQQQLGDSAGGQSLLHRLLAKLLQRNLQNQETSNH